jgi:hypothetical protein
MSNQRRAETVILSTVIMALVTVGAGLAAGEPAETQKQTGLCASAEHASCDLYAANGMLAGRSAEDELLASRTWCSKHFRNADGSITAYISLSALHQLDSAGQWVDRTLDTAEPPSFEWDGASGFSLSGGECYCGDYSCGDVVMWRGADVYNGWMYFDTFSIPAGSHITDTDIHLDVEESYCPYFYIRALDQYTTYCSDMWWWEHNGTIYFTQSSCSGFPSSGAWSADLGSSADADLEDNLDHDPPYFGVSFHDFDDSSDWYATVDGYDWFAGPYLTVTYSPPRPDLVVDWVSTSPSCPVGGSQYRITARVHNIGQGAVPWSTLIHLHHKVNGVVVDEDDLWLGMGPGEYDDVESILLSASTQLDEYDIEVCVDPHDAIDEEDDSNNCEGETYTWGTPNSPSADPTSGCRPLDVTLHAASGYDTYDWQYRPPGGGWTDFDGSGSGASYTCTTAGDWQFRYRARTGPCWSSWGNARTVTVHDLPVCPGAPSASNPSGCRPVSGTLTAGSGWSSYDWQYRPPDGSWHDFGGSGRTQSYTADESGTWQYRYRVQNSPGCWSDWCSAAFVVVFPIPDDPGPASASPAAGCAPLSGILTAAPGWSAYDWQQRPPGGGWEDFGGGGQTQSYAAGIVGSWCYRYRVQNTHGCWSGWGDEVCVAVVPRPPVPTATADPPEICIGDSCTLHAHVDEAEILWYEEDCSGEAFAAQDSVVVTPSHSTTYHARAHGEYCDSDGCDAVAVVVNQDIVPWYPDRDNDDFGDEYETSPVMSCVAPAGPPHYVRDNTDCNDDDPGTHPGATEVCDGSDNDCDGSVDEGVGPMWYRDADNDGYGDGTAPPLQACYQPDGYVDNPNDCDDTNPEINPGAQEVCDGVDNDCDTLIDEGFPVLSWYRDHDEDGYGDPDMSVQACEQPPGYVGNPDDCNDEDAAIHPDAPEVCDGIDNNCDTQVDEGFPLLSWCRDADEDGYGDPDSSVEACSQPPGCVGDCNDCDDTDVEIHPGATEVCDGVDNNCDGQVDEGLTLTTWYRDADGDGYADCSLSIQSCDQPAGYIAPTECDCDDDCSSCHPGALEVCDNGVDEDCDGLTDCDDPDCATNCPGPWWYRDADGDGYGNPNVDLAVRAVQQPEGYVSNSSDCNDSCLSCHPGAVEVCGNEIDDDCDGQADEEGAQGCATYYRDHDNDGYGLRGDHRCLCAPDGEYSAIQGGDCDDNDAKVNPSVDIDCGNGKDDDCDGLIDEDGDCVIPPDPNDFDADGIPNSEDNCPNTYNPDQVDVDGNGIGDACDGANPCGAGLCGRGALGALPLTLLGLCALKAQYRRPRR